MQRTTISLSDPLHRAILATKGAILLGASVDVSRSEIIEMILIDSIIRSTNEYVGADTISDWRLLVDEEKVERFEQLREHFQRPEVVAQLADAQLWIGIAREIERELVTDG